MDRGKLIAGCKSGSKRFHAQFGKRIKRLADDITKAGYDRFDASHAVASTLMLHMVFNNLRRKIMDGKVKRG